MKALPVCGANLRQACQGLRGLGSDDAHDKGLLACDPARVPVAPLARSPEQGQSIWKARCHLPQKEVRPLGVRYAAMSGDTTSKQQFGLHHRLAIDQLARSCCAFGGGCLTSRNEDKPRRGVDQCAHEIRTVSFAAPAGDVLGVAVRYTIQANGNIPRNTASTPLMPMASLASPGAISTRKSSAKITPYPSASGPILRYGF